MPEPSKSDCLNSRPYRLVNTVQHYAWGTCNENAYIADLLGIDPKPDQPFAELWMGVHPKSPSQIIDPEQGPRSLSSWISENVRERLSIHEGDSFPEGLPYLLKVLSAGEALSIQAHPNKQQAESLHQRDPEHYPDNNHKPEIAIAIDNLDALLGFISNHKFFELLAAFPELESLINTDFRPVKHLKEGVQRLFRTWDRDKKSIAATSSQIQRRLVNKPTSNETEQLFLEQFDRRGPEDIGLLFLLLLNRVHLGPGEAVFLAPGVPHAYIKGNIIECMANSDNVVRLGLTNKFCDASALSEILVYDELAEYRIIPGTQGHLREYAPPVKEFRIKSLDLPDGKSEAFSSRTRLTMFVLIQGEISLDWGNSTHSCSCLFRRGDAFVTPANLSAFKILARHDAKLFFVELPEAKTR